jgi:RNA polymerase sigma-70 factor (ECF subfamily)
MSEGDFDMAACLERVRQQDQEAARMLVTHLYPLVLKVVRSHLPRRVSEDDLAQEIFMKLFQRLEQYQPRQAIPFEHWVSRIAVNTCLDALRSQMRRPELRWADLSEAEAAWLDFFVSTEAESSPPAADAVAARELMQTLLAELSPQDRLVINLLDLEQKSVKQISEITGWSKSLVKVRAFRARRKLRKLADQFKKREEIYETIRP